MTSSLLQIAPTPADLGLPAAKFPTWRKSQPRAITDGLESRTRFTAQALSTGAGKSVIAVAQGMAAGRAVYLTSTKALQKQLLDDFGECGMADIRGRSNYACVYGQSRAVTCEDGALLGCRGHREGICPYVNALGLAKAAPLPETNYSYWMNVNRYGDGLGDVDLLICDEVHSALDEICGMLTIELPYRDLHTLRPLQPLTIDAPIEEWRSWAKTALAGATMLTKALEARLRGETHPANGNASESVSGPSEGILREVRQMKGLCQRLERLAQSKGNWVADNVHQNADGSTARTGLRFDPVWPADYAEDILWCGVPRVLLTSATVNRKTCRLLGIPDEELTFLEYPPVFDPRKSPIERVRTVRVDSRMSEDDVRAWISRIDQILRANPSRKGIIHCTSYQRQRDIYRMSGERRRLLWHSSWNTQAKIEEFKRMPEESGAVLLSPAVTCGYDFKGNLCRFIIVAKVPLIDRRDRITKARLREDADWGDYLEAQTFEQEVGRATRDEEDWVHVYVLDDHFWAWWYPKMRRKGLVSKALQARVVRW